MNVVYHCRALGPRPWIIAWGLLALFSLVPPWFVDADESVRYRLAMIPVYAITWGVWVWVVVTDEELRVGRERVPLADIAPVALRNALADLTGAPAVPDRAGEPSQVHGPVRAAGGALAAPLGAGGVTVPMRNRRRLDVRTRDPIGFLTALASVLPD